MLDLIMKILHFIRETESAEMNGPDLESVSKRFGIEKNKAYEIMKGLEKEGFIEERIFQDGSKDFSLENKGIELIQSLEKSKWISKYTQKSNAK